MDKTELENAQQRYNECHSLAQSDHERIHYEAILDEIEERKTELAQIAALAGKCVKAFLFICLQCQKQSVRFSMVALPITKTEAVALMRADGWQKSKPGWRCAKCKKSHSVVNSV